MSEIEKRCLTTIEKTCHFSVGRFVGKDELFFGKAGLRCPNDFQEGCVVGSGHVAEVMG